MTWKGVNIILAVLLFFYVRQTAAQRPAPGRTTDEIFRAHFNPAPLKAMDSYPSAYRIGNRELSRLKADSADLYRGIALLKAGKAAAACMYLEKAARHMKETVSNVSEWYLALAYLRKGSTSQAEYMFHKIAETEIHPYQDEAEVVYQQLIRLRTK